MNITREIRYAARGLRKNLGFALVVILTLGFGMGANAAIFSLMDQVLLRTPAGSRTGAARVSRWPRRLPRPHPQQHDVLVPDVHRLP